MTDAVLNGISTKISDNKFLETVQILGRVNLMINMICLIFCFNKLPVSFNQFKSKIVVNRVTLFALSQNLLSYFFIENTKKQKKLNFDI